jgi:hypothetical protein
MPILFRRQDGFGVKDFEKHYSKPVTPWQKVSTQKPLHDIIIFLITSLWRMSAGAVVPVLCSAGSISGPRYHMQHLQEHTQGCKILSSLSSPVIN